MRSLATSQSWSIIWPLPTMWMFIQNVLSSVRVFQLLNGWFMIPLIVFIHLVVGRSLRLLPSTVLQWNVLFPLNCSSQKVFKLWSSVWLSGLWEGRWGFIWLRLIYFLCRPSFYQKSSPTPKFKGSYFFCPALLM